ncbi:MAG: Cob(I)yrinic acid a,c-diamide adenosyltransferase [Calditrichaeota bacterium]|nr:Cob(I)yrinic acid a,c-diamide adenosyltransferase [Calditrichota bacterium]
MKIYTKSGDKGETSLLTGGRVPKHHPRVEAYGTMDELNSLVGYVRAIANDPGVQRKLARLQEMLHILSSDVASAPADSPGEIKIPRITDENVRELELGIDQMAGELPALEHFILPGGAPEGASLHVARAICRRGERRFTELVEHGAPVSEAAIRFVNRLSDYLFTLARWTNHRAGQREIPWIGREHTG